MNKTIIEKIALCQGLIDYWQGECKNMEIDGLDLDNDLDTINNVLNEVLKLISKNNEKK